MRNVAMCVGAVLLSLCSVSVAADAPAEKYAGDCWLPAFRAGDAEAVTACYAADAVMWIPGAPTATGSKEIHDMYAGFFAENTIKDVELTELGSQTSGDTHTAWGTFRLVTASKDGGTETVETGRYTDVQKKIGGHWVYIVDHASDEPAADDAAPTPDAG